MIASKQAELEALKEAREEVARVLYVKGYSYRAVAEMVGLSHVRVRELIRGEKTRYPVDSGYDPKHGRNA